MRTTVWFADENTVQCGDRPWSFGERGAAGPFCRARSGLGPPDHAAPIPAGAGMYGRTGRRANGAPTGVTTCPLWTCPALRFAAVSSEVSMGLEPVAAAPDAAAVWDATLAPVAAAAAGALDARSAKKAS